MNAATDQRISALSALYNGKPRPVGLPLGDVGEHLSRRRISLGLDTFELGATGTSGRRFGAMPSIKDYPAQTSPGTASARELAYALNRCLLLK